MALSGSGPYEVERRAAGRFHVHANLRIIRLHDMTACQARLVNISDCGVALAPDEPLTYGSRVYVEIRRFHLSGAAQVRRTITKSSGYFAALEFDGPLRLDAI